MAFSILEHHKSPKQIYGVTHYYDGKKILSARILYWAELEKRLSLLNDIHYDNNNFHLPGSGCWCRKPGLRWIKVHFYLIIIVCTRHAFNNSNKFWILKTGIATVDLLEYFTHVLVFHLNLGWKDLILVFWIKILVNTLYCIVWALNQSFNQAK